MATRWPALHWLGYWTNHNDTPIKVGISHSHKHKHDPMIHIHEHLPDAHHLHDHKK